MAPDPNATAAALDDIFDNYMIESDEDDPFRDLDTTLQLPAQDNANKNKRKTSSDRDDDGLGIDEEIKVTKKRKPVPKLDETRLLSQMGLPKLKSSFRSKVAPKLKGKGHEFSDCARILNFYQLWLDALYPRAKFADGLAMIEKAGHSKRMQVMRKTWIDEGKRRNGDYMDDDFEGRMMDPQMTDTIPVTSVDEPDTDRPAAAATAFIEGPQQHDSIFGNGKGANSLFIPDTGRSRMVQDDAPEDDELEALLQEHALGRQSSNASKLPQNADSEGEDDLDAWPAEESHSKPRIDAAKVKAPIATIDEDDDLEALLAEHDARNAKTVPDAQDAHATTKSKMDASSALASADDTEDEDDLDALFAQEGMQKSSEAVKRSIILASVDTLESAKERNSQEAIDEPDDLDDMLAEMSKDFPTTKYIAHGPELTPDEDSAPFPLSSSPVKDPAEADLDEDELDGMFS